ncbi:MAG: UDP-N-acetylenolpyruvoylglucosamine reductase [Candidatus Andersenbacteria bacterium RIFCSPHIGHO2_02_FULL_45_11]|uniref:UDP-N-acetylenolpyruvoylglucosamine reductase n=1 Tax=Candidatus Andersenbacteria bacterium RIFCSPHIGHO2_12_FULL_45_11 TaxID=1797281 RepID=A0A1G1X2P5_9BACT|nr:MAG: UDP-N-acetylenolpyruvoylglucosamine reductase [Candidatus Andersenbacteria bacterium RIFCSPHIGHO2_01_FULL_46_36]OGY32899.1 MAG: UDP-N-acetylenolpyruvoylglucosamine reductase [Candidatus Andersenbacteria bacterium RIFCSPHIGHO2_02_FULL_45_11]OGY34061.1 MAG: UDP-N-acetylenolpyruvoylglucosamine reductase [Candidatus Andersenbacteria bacterium RIFCSPHIGHO2_12_FULL_45_11]
MNIQNNIPLAPLTTIKLGGNASQYITCTTNEDIVAALKHAQEHNLPAGQAGLRVHVLGGGSNTIFADNGFNGLIIHIQTKGITASADGTLTAQAGEGWDTVVQYAIVNNLAGIECLSGIPGSAGATPFQNVGAYGQEVAETIIRVDAINRQTLEQISFTNTDCNFAYRTSRFKTTDRDRYIITSVTFSLTPNGTPTIKYPELAAFVATSAPEASLASVRDAVLTLRKKKSMVVGSEDPNSISCGSFFTNPIIALSAFNALQQHSADKIPNYPAGNTEDGTLLCKLSAAWLVEHAGFSKGLERGNVGISQNHSLALINKGGTTQEILALAQEIQDTVQTTFGVKLEMEPIVVD